MLPTRRLAFAAAGLAAVVALFAGTARDHSALAQGTAAGQGDEAPKQIVLTQKMIDGMLAAQPEMSAAQEKAQAGNKAANTDQPDPNLQAQMEALAKKNGFASFDEYENAVDSVGIVMAGIDPETKTYVGPAVVIKKQMTQVEADKALPPLDKAKAVKEMKEALAAVGSSQPAPGNADIVAKNYDKLSEAFQSGE